MCAFLFNRKAILTILLVEDIALSSFLQIGCVNTFPFSLSFFLWFNISSSSECTDTILEVLAKTFSISSSLWTNKFPVEDPANNLTPQHPSKLLRSASSSWFSGVAPK